MTDPAVRALRTQLPGLSVEMAAAVAETVRNADRGLVPSTDPACEAVLAWAGTNRRAFSYEDACDIVARVRTADAASEWKQSEAAYLRLVDAMDSILELLEGLADPDVILTPQDRASMARQVREQLMENRPGRSSGG
jgi:hypothetical protein